ncbi:hypothetical protein [Roseibium sp.]|uniref:hypothetical protein n=1 Tax=Roseibium sp. TaxID=1936156 RepID=UPI003BAB1203
MRDRYRVLWGGVCLAVLAALSLLGIMSVNAYQKLFLDLAVFRLMCLQEYPGVLAPQLAV